MKKGLQPEIYINRLNIKKIKNILGQSKEMLKVVSLVPELIGSIDLIRFLKEDDIIVAMGHFNALYNEDLYS